ncbi:uncharacterized protein NPIL_677991 [Nephila pilipes]|uniref:Uncharacterized protein n=1 Tax=Nephila pilipes TaxID=299642 RepID=A0A8X6P019_NEPPI|nr:uncharacterized protein NPIL_677991 [Nephila pilipes]
MYNNSSDEQTVCFTITSGEPLLNVVSTLIYGVYQSRSRITSISSTDELTEDNEPPAKRRIPVCIPHDSARKKDMRHMPETMALEVTVVNARM